MQKLSITELSKIVSNWDTNGFTHFFNKKGRYVVGFTHNTTACDIDSLYAQYLAINNAVNLTVGGWTDTKTMVAYVDLGLAIDSLDEAIIIARQFAQIAIWDSVDMKEVRIQY